MGFGPLGHDSHDDAGEAASLDHSPEKVIAVHIARRGLLVSPLWIAICGLIWGYGAAASAAYGVVLVLANLFAAAALMNWAIRISPVALMATTLGGFIVRLGLLFVAVLAVSSLDLFEPIPLGITIAICHLGLLVWEIRYVSGSLAGVGVEPSRPTPMSASTRVPGQTRLGVEQTDASGAGSDPTDQDAASPNTSSKEPM